MTTIPGLDYTERTERLASIAETLAEGKATETVRVRDLLGWFGAARRGVRVVRRVRYALRAAGLMTDPDFEAAWIDASVEFKLAKPELPSRNGTPNGNSAHVVGPEAVVSPGADLVSLGIGDPTNRIGKLPAANNTPLAVKPDEGLQCAVTLMLAHDYSQIPVMTTERDVKGIVSWRSIASRWALGREGDFVRDYLEEPHDIFADRPLFEALPIIIDKGFILVRDSTRKVVGIVTASDLGAQFRQLAEPFLLLGEIENHIRRLIDGKFTKEELASLKEPGDNRPIESVADLTFGQYVRLLEDPKHWAKVAPNIDRGTFTRQLDEVREIRNDVMHFDPDPMEASDLETLRRFARFLQTLQVLGV